MITCIGLSGGCEVENISFYNIETNNLKSIDFHVIENACNTVVGPSGSGKSSLVFDTINAVAQDEYNTMVGSIERQSKYKVGSFNKILMSAPLQQLNYNTNPRSTIATYYHIDASVKKIFSILFEKESNFFSFNKYHSTCKTCNGLGYVLEPSESFVIDYDASIAEIPFYPWKGSYSDLYRQLLTLFAENNQIPTNKPFRELNENDQRKLLYYSGDKKYKINYTQGTRKRVKTTKYIGVMEQLKQDLKKSDSNSIRFSQKTKCTTCGGTRFSKKINAMKINNKSIGEVYLLNCDDLIQWASELLIPTFELEINSIVTFANKLIDFKLEYLNLNRSIESLSGGEFQRLRLSQLLNSKLENILYILDEPLSSLHASEKKHITQEILKLKQKSTLLIIEHDNDFIDQSDLVTVLGPAGGKDGGELVSFDCYKRKYATKKYLEKKNPKEFITIENPHQVNNVKPFKLDLPLGICIGVCGVSGSGKTTFARDILSKRAPNYTYISQKPIRGNAYSIVATYIEVIDKIRQLFSTNNKISKSMFSFFHSAEGACKTCNGLGKVVVEEYNYKYSYICPDCEGTRFSNNSLNYLYKDLNIHEALSLDISEAINFFEDDKEIVDILSKANDIGLGHLKLNQSIDTLSGGENQRVKLLKHINNRSNNRIIALDEPFRGLNNFEIYKIMKVLNEYVDNNTVIIIEHNIYAIELCSYIIEFGEGSGEHGGEILFSGIQNNIHGKDKSIIRNYLV